MMEMWRDRESRRGTRAEVWMGGVLEMEGWRGSGIEVWRG